MARQTGAVEPLSADEKSVTPAMFRVSNRRRERKAHHERMVYSQQRWLATVAVEEPEELVPGRRLLQALELMTSGHDDGRDGSRCHQS
jgi:hypothetical protein